MKSSRPLAALVLGGMKPKKKEFEDEMDEAPEGGEEDDMKVMAAEELISALKQGDAQAVVEAFSALVDMCGGY